MPTLVHARPDRLQQLRRTAGGLAEGLDVRCGALSDAVGRYRSSTEAAFEVDCASAPGSVRTVARALRELGDWVGQVGDAFERAPATVSGGVHQLSTARLDAELPLGLHAAALLEARRGRPDDHRGDRDGDARGGDHRGDDDGTDDDSGGTDGDGRNGGGTDSDGDGDGRNGDGTDRGDGRRPAAAGTAGAAGSAIDELGVARSAAEGPSSSSGPGPAAGLVGAARAAFDEAVERWAAEPDRPGFERAARAGLDGALNGLGTYGGAAAGGWAGGALCAPTVIGAAPCAAVGGYVGGVVGRWAGEAAGDAILGPESEPWERHPDDLADAIGDVDAEATDELQSMIDAVVDDAEAAGDRHANFVHAHPWRWDDEYADAPHHEPPPPVPAAPIAGPR